MKKKKLNLKKIMILYILILILCVIGLKKIDVAYNKSKNIAEANHVTLLDDKKLMKYKNIDVLDEITDFELESKKILTDLEEFLTKDLEKIFKCNGSKYFFDENYEIFNKRTFSVEYNNFAKLYKILKKQNMDFTNDYKECTFKKSVGKMVEFKVFYENKFELTGYIVLSEENQFYLGF